MTDATPNLELLAPYVMGRTRRGVVGSSRYAKRLRSSIVNAAKDPKRQPLLFLGEPGLGKDNLAALVHFGSADRKRPLVRLKAEDLNQKSKALLDNLEGCNLLISGIDTVTIDLQHKLQDLASSPAFHGRVLFTSETCLADLNDQIQVIRVPPLRVRRADLGDWLRYQLKLQCPGLGWSQTPDVPDTVVRRLQNHEFPNNLQELETLVDRALRQMRRQAGTSLPTTLPEEVFWTDPNRRRARFDLWRWKPQLRQLMRTPALWNILLFGVVSWLFIAVNLVLWLGPQTRADNPMLILFWAWWWPLILLSYPIVGRLWCAICPFMVWGTIAQRLTPWRQRLWPRGNQDNWAAPSLAAGFGLILIWEEVWNLENTAWLSSCLLLLITAGAVLGSLVFEKRFWCRYLCPVGGMNGLFAKLSMLELRAEAGTCSGSCSSYACFKGGAADGEGLATAGCPLGTHPAHLDDNRNCVLCMTCASACPHRSVQLRLRPPAADLQRSMNAPDGERLLILVLAGGICLHQWQRLLGWIPAAPITLHEGPLLPRLSLALLALALPAAVGLWLDKRWLYAGLPLLWSLLLARHLPLGMEEAGLIFPPGWPSWSADPHVIGFCQTVAVLIGWGGAIVLTRRLLDLNRWQWLTSSMVLLIISSGGRWLVAG